MQTIAALSRWLRLVLDEHDNSGVPIDYLFTEVAVRDEVPRPRQFGMRLLSGTIQVVEDLAKQGTVVKTLFAVSSTPDGIKLCRSFGFQAKPLNPEATRFSFELDIQTAHLPYLREYQQIIREERHIKEA